MENLCQHVSVTLHVGQRSSNGKNYAIVCPNLTWLWRHSRTALLTVCVHSNISYHLVHLSSLILLSVYCRRSCCHAENHV